MTTILPFGSNSVPTFIYESFSYTISNPGSFTLTASNTPGIPPGYLVNNGSNVVFSALSNVMNVGTEVFSVTARDASGNVVATSTNTVSVGAGRFLDASGVSYAGRTFNFFKNEPITPIPLVAPFAIATPTTVPTLPPGLVYTSNASNIFTITGTPLVTVPQSNYLVIGKATGANLGKIVTSQIGLSVSNERINLSLSGTPIVSPMTVGTAILPRTITARFPPYPSGGTLRYTFTGIPDGIRVTDLFGNTQPSPFIPSDLSNTLILQGTPTIAAANAYRDAGISSNTVTFFATRTNPLPVISNSIAVTFGFGETVLFDSVTIPTLYSGVPLDPSANFFRAQTYFSTGSAISNIFSPNLRSDLSINFVPAQGRGYLTGTPVATGTGTFTIRAINSNAVSRDLSANITVASDSVFFVSPPTPAVDICYNFVLSRPVSLPLTGYYPANIQFQAFAASGNPINFSASGLSATGLSLSNVSANTVEIVGTPDTVTPFTTVTITADVSGTPATASRTFKLEILDDEITFSEPTPTQLSFIQNRAITPIQITATTLSERPVLSFTSPNLPTGLSITTTGLITGTPSSTSSGTFTVIASTGFMSDSNSYTYTLTPDSILLIEGPQQSYMLTLGGSIPPATVSGLSYSGIGVSNFVFTGLPITYGLTIDASTGIFGGTLTTSFPPDPVLPSNVTFTVQGDAGLLSETLPVELNTSNAARFQWFAAKGTSFARTESTLANWATLASVTDPLFPLTDYSIRPITVTSRSIIGITHSTEMLYSSNGSTFAVFNIPVTPWPFYGIPDAPDVGPDYTLNLGPKVIVRDSNSTTLYGTGYDVPVTQLGAFWKSTDDGQSWVRTFPLLATGVTGRSWLANAVSYGNAIAFQNNVLLIGGNGDAVFDPPIIRSTDGGTSWSAVTGGIETWVTAFNVDASRWIAAGSDKYFPGSLYGTPSRTLRYSDNQGANWSLVTSGDFDYLADFVVYGNGIWIAVGRQYNGGDGYIYYEFRTSTDGLVWSSFTLPAANWYPSTRIYIPFEDAELATVVTSILYDGTDFIVLVRNENFNGSISSFFDFAYTHAADGSSLSTGWMTFPLPDLTDIGEYGAPPLRLQGRFPIATNTPQPILSFPSQVGNGPIVTSPTQRSVLLYQYVPITPITFSATGTGIVYFFVENDALPRGITFDSVTNTLIGTPVLLGNTTVTVYAKDDNGVSIVVLDFRVILPIVERQQTSAGAWTSLIRQYTIVNAAQNSVNGKVLPSNESILGEFTRPEPPDSVSASGDPNCVKKC